MQIAYEKELTSVLCKVIKSFLPENNNYLKIT